MQLVWQMRRCSDVGFGGSLPTVMLCFRQRTARSHPPAGQWACTSVSSMCVCEHVCCLACVLRRTIDEKVLGRCGTVGNVEVYDAANPCTL